MLYLKFFYSQACKTRFFLPSKAHLSTSPTFKEEKIKVRNHEINYLRVGRGDHHVFCAGGMLGSIWTDFAKQINGFDHDKFSLVVWDPPGHGNSVVLGENETWDIFSTDADIAYEFMKALKIPKYSALGWSSGGTSCLLLASRYPGVINKLAVWGCSSFLLPEDMEYYRNMRNLNTWSQPMKEAMFKLYGEEIFKRKINKLVNEILAFYDSKKTFCEEVKRVKSPTLILHGGKDPVSNSQHLENLHNIIKNSRTHLYPDGKHNIHMKYADDFNKRVQEFLLEEYY